MPDNKLIEKLNEYNAFIPPLSLPMEKALDAIHAPQADTKALSRLVMHDTILASKTFKLVNSAYFDSSSRQLASINKALMSLGAMKVKNIIIALVLQKMYEDDGPDFLFRHSIACATACELLAKEYKTINEDDAFILGFLHDAGMTVLKSKHLNTYEDLVKEAKYDFNMLYNLEKEHFGVTHCDLGAKLCEKWKMPKILVDTIKYHHQPLKAKIPFAAGIVYIADKIVFDNQDFNQDILDYLGITLFDTKIFKEKVMAKTELFLRELSDF